MRNLILSSAILLSVHANAQNSTLTVTGDLMIHPNQIAEYFTHAGSRIQSSATWNWDEMVYVKPYKTNWSQVKAKGPFNVKFTTDKLSGSEVTVDMTWNEPVIDVGQFEINDQMVRNVGGARVVINMQSTCANLKVRVPGGQWKARGRMGWTWDGSVPVFAWQDFQFTMNTAAKPEVDMGQCTGPQGLQAAVKEAVQSTIGDQAWFQTTVKQAMLDYVGESVSNLRDEVLKPRVVTMREGLTFTWEPKTLIPMNAGLLRVPGQLVFRKEFFKPYNSKLEVPNSESLLQSVSESGFVFPRETLSKAAEFLYNVGELQKRILSDTVPAFVDLMKSRTNQGYVWPDLQKFPTNAVFYFDLMAETVPTFSGGATLKTGGFTYNVNTTLLMFQWAPVQNRYVPYMDFRSKTNGTAKVTVSNQTLNVLYTPAVLPISYKFRPEIKAIRTVDPTFDANTFSTKGMEYLKTTPFTAKLPSWPINDGLSLGVRDTQLGTETLRVPLQLIKPAQK